VTTNLARCGATIHAKEPSTLDGRRCQQVRGHEGPHLAVDKYGARAWMSGTPLHPISYHDTERGESPDG
jgi:hypothetical protein